MPEWVDTQHELQNSCLAMLFPPSRYHLPSPRRFLLIYCLFIPSGSSKFRSRPLRVRCPPNQIRRAVMMPFLELLSMIPQANWLARHASIEFTQLTTHVHVTAPPSGIRCSRSCFDWSCLRFISMIGPYHHDDIIKWKHFPRYCPFVRGIHRSTVNFPHKARRCGALMFSLICAWLSKQLRRRWFETHCAHYDVTVIYIYPHSSG